ncbi:MAG: hydrogenase maturation protease, partial [Elusimicrobia bacterium]|nr:hydrogenase maturation protease [Elusimicrobiota bacterium]
MRTLVVGYGNPLRSDDGVGPAVALRVASRRLPRVKIKIVQQLNLELVDEMKDFDQVILVDACLDGPPVALRKVAATLQAAMASSHHCGPEMLLSLAAALYERPPAVYACAIREESFFIGRALTPAVRGRAREAAEMIVRFLKEQ